MPKDVAAIATIHDAFLRLIAFLKTYAHADAEEFNTEVLELLKQEGHTVIGYKKVLKYVMTNFAQRCHVSVYEKDSNDASDFMKTNAKQVFSSRRDFLAPHSILALFQHILTAQRNAIVPTYSSPATRDRLTLAN